MYPLICLPDWSRNHASKPYRLFNSGPISEVRNVRAPWPRHFPESLRQAVEVRRVCGIRFPVSVRSTLTVPSSRKNTVGTEVDETNAAGLARLSQPMRKQSVYRDRLDRIRSLSALFDHARCVYHHIPLLRIENPVDIGIDAEVDSVEHFHVFPEVSRRQRIPTYRGATCVPAGAHEPACGPASRRLQRRVRDSPRTPCETMVVAGDQPENRIANVWHTIFRRRGPGAAIHSNRDGTFEISRIGPGQDVSAALQGLGAFGNISQSNAGHVVDCTFLLHGSAIAEHTQRLTLELQEVEKTKRGQESERGVGFQTRPIPCELSDGDERL